MTRTAISNWSPWYVDLQNTTKVQCLVCGVDFTKKNSRMLSHLGYIPSTGARDSNVKLCKNVKPDVLRAFRECGGVAPAPPEPTESQHLQGSAESEEPICQGSQSSTMHASCGTSQNLAAACGPIRNSSGTASQLQPSAGLSSARSLQQSTIPVLHAEDQRRKCDMAWAEFFYSANIPFAAARTVSFKKAVKMTSEMRSSYLPPSYHDIRKQGCHIGRLSGKSHPKDVVRTNVRVDRPPADAPWRTAQADGHLADGQSYGRAHSHPTEKQPGTS
jgi:hypothetical protein